ncbi:MAG: hypothetical protein LUQ54_05275, partial [Methanoregula sp.]|nr:hypothetical protein [Methanoregula sp.]
MTLSRLMAGIRVLIIFSVLSWLLICPAVAISMNETPRISQDSIMVSVGPVVSGTNQNSTVIRIVLDNPCTPSLRYANESFFSVSKD